MNWTALFPKMQFSLNPQPRHSRGIKVDESVPEDSPYEMQAEIVQSLAKWKRILLDRLGCQLGEGIDCDSTSVRKGYKGDVVRD